MPRHPVKLANGDDYPKSTVLKIVDCSFAVEKEN